MVLRIVRDQFRDSEVGKIYQECINLVRIRRVVIFIRNHKLYSSADERQRITARPDLNRGD